MLFKPIYTSVRFHNKSLVVRYEMCLRDESVIIIINRKNSFRSWEETRRTRSRRRSAWLFIAHMMKHLLHSAGFTSHHFTTNLKTGYNERWFEVIFHFFSFSSFSFQHFQIIHRLLGLSLRIVVHTLIASSDWWNFTQIHWALYDWLVRSFEPSKSQLFIVNRRRMVSNDSSRLRQKQRKREKISMNVIWIAYEGW